MLRRSGLLTRIATERGSLCERMKSGLRFSNLNGSRARNCGYLHLPEQWLSLCLFRRHAQVHSNTARVYCGPAGGRRTAQRSSARQDVLGVALSLLLRSSIAQSAAMVSRSLVMCVAFTLPNVAGVRVGSSTPRTWVEAVAVILPESNCLIASTVAKRCAVVSFMASRFL